jgi:hypothetical protein
VGGVGIQQRQVFLPDAFDSGYFREPLISNLFVGGDAGAGRRHGFDSRINLPHAFSWPVVHDDDLRPDGIEKGRRASAIERAVATGLIQGYGSKLVQGTCQLHLFGPIEVDQIQIFKLAIGQQHAYGALVFGRDGSFLFRIGAERIRSAAVDRFRQKFLIGRDDQDAGAFQRNFIAGIHDGPLAG